MRAPTPTQTESFSQADHSTGLDLSDGTEDVLPRDPHLREHEPNKHLILSLQETVKRLLTEQHALHTKITNMQETMDFQNATIHLLEAELSAARRPSTTLDSAVDRANNALSKPSSSVKIASSTSSPGTGHTGQRRRSRQSVDSYSSARSSYEEHIPSSPAQSRPAHDGPLLEVALESGYGSGPSSPVSAAAAGHEVVGKRPVSSFHVKHVRSSPLASSHSPSRSLHVQAFRAPNELTAKKIEYAQLAGHYKRMGSASYRSDSPRFGSSLELAMRGATQAENPSLGAANPNIPGIGHYRDVERDARGTYWATSKKTESLWNLPADHDFGY